MNVTGLASRVNKAGTFKLNDLNMDVYVYKFS